MKACIGREFRCRQERGEEGDRKGWQGRGEGKHQVGGDGVGSAAGLGWSSMHPLTQNVGLALEKLLQ